MPVMMMPGMVSTMPVALSHDDPFSAIAMGGPLVKHASPFAVLDMPSVSHQPQHQPQLMNGDRDKDKDKGVGELVNPFDLFT